MGWQRWRMGVGDDAGSIVNDGYQAGRLIKYSRLGLADSVRSRKDQWTAIHYKAAIGFVNISTTCITAVGQQQSVSQPFATPMQFDWDGGSQTGWLLGMTFKECEAQKALG